MGAGRSWRCRFKLRRRWPQRGRPGSRGADRRPAVLQLRGKLPDCPPRSRSAIVGVELRTLPPPPRYPAAILGDSPNQADFVSLGPCLSIPCPSALLQLKRYQLCIGFVNVRSRAYLVTGPTWRTAWHQKHSLCKKQTTNVKPINSDVILMKKLFICKQEWGQVSALMPRQ